MSDIKNSLKKSNQYCVDIIDKVSKALSNKKIKHDILSNNEILIKNKKGKDKNIAKIVYSIDIDDSIIKLSIDIVTVNDDIYIRRKIK